MRVLTIAQIDLLRLLVRILADTALIGVISGFAILIVRNRINNFSKKE